MEALNNYNIQHGDSDSHFVFSGEMRLHSPIAYDEPFSDLKQSIESPDTPEVVLDIGQLEYLNSSGITSFARLILLASKHSKPLKIIYNKTIPWQTKNVVSLAKLHPKIELQEL